jgi:SAM-dependent methyltransferase
MTSAQGYVDSCDDGYLSGWARGTSDDPVAVEIFCDGVHTGVAKADRFREDLKAAGIGAGRHGFEFKIPDGVRFRSEYIINATACGVTLGNCPFHIREDLNPLRSGGRRLRRFVAAQFCSGAGIEIGALHRPMPVPAGVTVRYVDALSTEELRHVWSEEVTGHELAPVDIITDATTLNGVTDASTDFVIASHLIEHMEDPVRALMNFVRVVRRGGTVLLIVPNRNHTFDAERPPTSVAHVIRDYCGGPQWSRQTHYEEWVRVVEKINTPYAAAARVEHLMQTRYAIHFHVWSPSEFSALLAEVEPLSTLRFDVIFFSAQENEGIWILRRRS